MEPIIKKAIEGGYPTHLTEQNIHRDYYLSYRNVCDPIFWQALGKACGWKDESIPISEELFGSDVWQEKALRFHEINLTEGWDKAVEYLLTIAE